MSNFIVFGGDIYYPAGGWDDLKGTAKSLEEAKEKFATDRHSWMHVVDLNQDGQVVYREANGKEEEDYSYYD